MAKVTIQDNSKKTLAKIKRLIDSKIKESANKSVGFIKNRFRTGKDVNDSPFISRQNKDEGRATLVRTGQLMNSVRSAQIKNGFILFAGDNSKIKYAKIHNEGGEIRITKKMRSYFWAMYAKTKKPYFKFLALKQGSIKIPKREFFGLNQREIGELIALVSDIDFKD